MQPREFDDLLREKSDQFEFGYNPKNWDKLVNQMDKKKGSSRRIFLWIPLAALASGASIAASLAMIIGIPSLLKQRATPAIAQVVIKHTPAAPSSTNIDQLCDIPVAAIVKADISLSKSPAELKNEIVPSSGMKIGPVINIADEKITQPEKVYNTFAQKGEPKQNSYNRAYIYNSVNEDAQEYVRRNIKTMISITGGYNYGTASNGYSIGATGKRMLGDKFYIEGEVAFVNNNTSEKMLAAGNATTTSPVSSPKVLALAKLTVLAKTTSEPPLPDVSAPPAAPDYKQGNYNSYYAQVAPVIGYNVMKHLSVGVGADMQGLLSDNRVAGNTADGLKGSPNFDMGLIGKTECSITKKIRAGLYYRKGMNNVIDPGSKYLERSYVQVQLKYTIFKH